MGNILTGRITSLTVEGNTISNCKFLRWRSNHTITPRLLPSSKIPVGYLQSHIWVEGEIGLLSYDSNLTAPTTDDASVLTPFIATSIDTEGNTRTFTFSNLIIAGVDKELGAEEPTFTYRFFAYSVAES